MNAGAGSERAEAIFQADLGKVVQRTDRMFFWLLIGQWIFAVAIALVWSPRTWIAEYWSVNQHLVVAALFGGLFAAYPLYLIVRRPGTLHTRHMIAVGQMLQSALLVHVTGGRIETHFHVFGSLALLAFYRDWPVLITGAAVVYLDHLALGMWFPLSVYGVTAAPVWRAFEHAFWVVFEVVFLIMSCRSGIRELHAIADREVRLAAAAVEVSEAHKRLESTNVMLEERVVERTEELEAQRKAALNLAQDAEEARKRTEQAEQSLKIFAAKLEVSNKELEQFAYVASHDLQEPLRKVQAFGDRLRAKCDDMLGEEGRDYLDRMQNAARRMQTLVNDLLKYSRVATTAQGFSAVDLGSVVNDVLSDLEVQIERTGGRVEVHALPTIEADPLQMRQLFQNLIGNALKFHRPEEQPIVNVYCREETTNSLGQPLFQIAVEDNGIGFDEKYLDRIFGPFQRLHGLGEYEGSGIGLAVCSKIVGRHGGSVTARSAPGQGASFIVTLPATRSELEAAA